MRPSCSQPLDLLVVEHARAVVHDAERPDAVPVGQRERHAGVEAQPRAARDVGVVGEAVVVAARR